MKFNDLRVAHKMWSVILGLLALMLVAAIWTSQRLFAGAPRPEHANLAPLNFSERWILTLLSLVAAAAGIMPSLWIPGDLPGS